jgi:hypothetical protein
MMVIMIMLKSANISNNVINRSSRVVDTLRMCKHSNNTYCRNSLLQKQLHASRYSVVVPSHAMNNGTCTMSA